MATDTNEDDVKVVVRLAQPDDYEQLLQVDSSVYFGHDYLPAKFHKFLGDPSRQFSVILVNDVLAGFYMVQVVDGGQTVVAKSLRLAQSMRSKKIISRLKQIYYLTDRLDKDFPNWRYYACATTSWQDFQRKPGKPRYMMTLYRAIVWMEMLPDADLMLLYPSSPNTLPSTTDTVLTVLTQADLVQALESRENQWRLFPHGWVLVGFEPYRLMSENWQQIYDKCNLVVASNRVGANVDKSSELVALSFSNVYYTNLGTLCEIDYYGTDATDLVRHVAMHVKLAARWLAKGSLYVCISLPLAVPESVARQVLDRPGIFKFTDTEHMRLALFDFGDVKKLFKANL